MKRLGLKVIQRRAYKVTTRRKDSHPVADNLLNQDFNPAQANQAWAGDVTYLWTHEGWMYLAVVMDLYSRKIIAWAMDKRMTVDLVERAMQMAITLRNPAKELSRNKIRISRCRTIVRDKLLPERRRTS